MRTKLLLAAATLAAGLASSMAQSNVYSVNVVGYYNVTVPGGLLNHGVEQAFVANQLTNANDISVDLINGVASDPNGVNNTVIAFWTGLHYIAYQFYTDADANAAFGASFGTGWYDSSGNIYHVPLSPGAAAFLQNPYHTNLTVTVVGQVMQGNYSVSIPRGNTALSLIPPVGTNIDSFPTFPGVSDGNGVVNDVLAFWDPILQKFASVQWYTDGDANTAFGASFGTGWYDSSGNLQSTNKAFQPTVGEGFFIQRYSGGTSNWVYNFTVQ